MKKSEFPSYSDYPFEVKGLSIVKKADKEGNAKKQLIHESGELITVSEIEFGSEKVIDPVPYIKLYSEGRDIIPKLGKRGTAVLCYVLGCLKPGVRHVDMHYKDVIDAYPYLKGDGFYIGISELMTYGVIAMRSGRGQRYWVNMNMFFNGDRRRVRKKIIP